MVPASCVEARVLVALDAAHVARHPSPRLPGEDLRDRNRRCAACGSSALHQRIGARQRAQADEQVDGDVGDALLLVLARRRSPCRACAAAGRTPRQLDDVFLVDCAALRRRRVQARGRIVSVPKPVASRHAPAGVAAEHAEALDRVVEDVADGGFQFRQRGADVLQARERDVQAQDLVGAFEDRQDAGVARDLLVRELAHEAVAAGDLQRLVRRALDRVAGEDLAHRRFDRVVVAARIDVVRHHPDRALGGEAVDGHLRDLLAHQAEARRSACRTACAPSPARSPA